MEAGQGVIEAGQDAVDAGREAVEQGQRVVEQAQDTVGAAQQLIGACDLVREAIAPGTPPEDSAALLRQALDVVSGVVEEYPDLPGIADLESGVVAAREALRADPSGASLGITREAVESACSQIPTLG